MGFETFPRTKLYLAGLGVLGLLPRDSAMKSWSLESQKEPLIEAQLLGALAISYLSLSEHIVHKACLLLFASCKVWGRLLCHSVCPAPAEQVFISYLQ